MWWTYFDSVAEAAEERLRTMREAVLAANDAYSYLHLLLVAGIIVFAVGAKKAVGHADEELSDAARLALYGGVALYLAGHVAFRLRLMGTASLEKLAALTGALVAYFVTGGAPAWVSEALLVGLLAALIARENVIERTLRTRLRHGSGT